MSLQQSMAAKSGTCDAWLLRAGAGLHAHGPSHLHRRPEGCRCASGMPLQCPQIALLLPACRQSLVGLPMCSWRAGKCILLSGKSVMVLLIAHEAAAQTIGYRQGGKLEGPPGSSHGLASVDRLLARGLELQLLTNGITLADETLPDTCSGSHHPHTAVSNSRGALIGCSLATSKGTYDQPDCSAWTDSCMVIHCSHLQEDLGFLPGLVWLG